MKIKNGLLYLCEDGFREGEIEVQGQKIQSVSMVQDQGGAADTSAEEILDAEGCYVLPGLVDVHFHGCAGHDFCEGTPEAMEIIEQYELTHGITTICPATMTLSEETLTKICTCAGSYVKKSACLKGINLEGPFLSEAKKGAQNGRYLHKPDADMLHRLNACSGGLVKLVAIAPELPGSMECIRQCGGEFQFSVAHTEADYRIASEAMEAGATHVTHLYNAMKPFSHRAPGVIGAAFDHHADVELISDGIHIDPCVVRATFQLFGKDQVILISDSMMATGMPDGDYELGGQPVKVNGTLATLQDGTLAGSATNLYDCMVHAIHFGVAPEAAIAAATCNPARSIGISDSCGSIEAGKAADLLIVDKDWKLRKIVKAGKVIA